MSEEADGGGGPKLRRDVSITGASCCPACGGQLPPAADQCPRCGWGAPQVAPRSARAAASGAGFLAGIAGLVLFLARALLFLVLLAVAAVVGTMAYERWTAPAAPGRESLFSNPFRTEPISCPTCRGQRKTTCATCGGQGWVAGVIVQTPCDQCGGTGNYKQRLKNGVVKCPFCRGTGKKETKAERSTCTGCEGTGQAPCAACGGTGTSKPAP